VDFLVLVELFSLGVLRRYERITIENRRYLLERGQFGPKFQVEGVVTYQVSSPTNHTILRVGKLGQTFVHMV